MSRQNLFLTALYAAAATLLLFSQAHAGPYRNAVLADNPAGYWRMESDGATLPDIAGTAQDGIRMIDGAGTTSLITGPITSETSNNAILFNSPDNSNAVTYEIADTTSQLGSDGASWTVEYWMNISPGGNPHQNVVAKGDHNDSGATFFNKRSGDGRLDFGLNSGAPDTVAGANPAEGQWTHIVTTLERDVPSVGQSTATMYVNGAVAALVHDPVGGGVIGGVQSPNANEPLSIGGLCCNFPGTVNNFNGAIDEVAVYPTILNADRVLAHFEAAGFTPEPDPTSQTWNPDASGDWNAAGNWNNSIVPDGTDQDAIFAGAISAPRTVFTENAVTVKSLTFDNANEYVISGNGSVNLESNSDNASIAVVSGNHQLQAITNLATDTDADIATGSALTFTNSLNLGGNTLTKTGGGDLNVNNILVTGGGTLNVQAGAVTGNGAVGGDLINSGIVSPGSGSASLLAVPEPSAIVLCLFGVSCFVLRIKRQA